MRSTEERADRLMRRREGWVERRTFLWAQLNMDVALHDAARTLARSGLYRTLGRWLTSPPMVWLDRRLPTFPAWFTFGNMLYAVGLTMLVVYGVGILVFLVTHVTVTVR